MSTRYLKFGPVVVVIASALLLPLSPAAASTNSGSCPDTDETETGVCVAAIPQLAMTPYQAEQAASKEADIEAISAEIKKPGAEGKNRSETASPDITVPPGDGGGTAFELPEVANMTIYKEGQGDDKKSYTCGPAATRNMVSAMYKYHTGAYKDFGEDQFVKWEGTTPAGTSRANVAAALNNHFAAYGHWTAWRPSDKLALLGTITADTKAYHQSVLLNIDTEELSFWNNKALDHFDLAYGWDATGDTPKVYVAEEWDPIFIYGGSSYGNPYGHHKEALGHVYKAVTKTSIHGIVS